MTDHHILHLHRRAGFGLSPGEWRQKQHQPAAAAVEELFRGAHAAAAAGVPAASGSVTLGELREMSREERAEMLRRERERTGQLNFAWLERMADPAAAALLERMTLFWHGHFACQIQDSRAAESYLGTLRRHALGNFRDLALGVAREPAMIRFLNNQQNRKEQPNENFARELLELFTIGRGNYTEQDVKEAARAFTGWSSNPGAEFLFRPMQHDYEEKTFMSRTGRWNGDDIIDIVLERRETAAFIARKVYRYFVNDEVDEKRVRELAEVFFNSGYDIGRLMRHLLTADWFYAAANVGNRIKAPIDLLAGLMRTLEVRFTDWRSGLFVQRALGQMLFNPPNVAGWPLGRRWIDNASLMLRLNLPNYLFKAAEFNMQVRDEPEAENRFADLVRMDVRLNWQPLTGWLGDAGEQQAFDALQTYLLGTPTALTRNEIETHLDRKDGYVPALTLRLLSLPEYQVS